MLSKISNSAQRTAITHVIAMQRLVELIQELPLL